MSNLFLSANQLMSQSDSNSHKCNLFMAMLGSSDVIPLDGNGLFSIKHSATNNCFNIIRMPKS